MPNGGYYHPGEPAPFVPFPPDVTAPAPLIREPLSWREIRLLEDEARSLEIEERLKQELLAAGRGGNLPPRIRTALTNDEWPPNRGRGPWSRTTHYRTFRAADKGRHWGIYIGAEDLLDIAFLAVHHGLAPVKAFAAAKELITNMLVPQFLTDRAVLTVEQTLALVGEHRNLWVDFYTRSDTMLPGSDLEIAICGRHAALSASKEFRNFADLYVSGLKTAHMKYDPVDDRIGPLSPGQAVSQLLSDIVAHLHGSTRATGLNGLWFAHIPDMLKPDLWFLFPGGRRVSLPVTVIPG